MPMMLEHFELKAKVAAGGMGTVYKASDTVLQRDVAIKLMQPELAEDEAGLSRLRRGKGRGAIEPHEHH